MTSTLVTIAEKLLREDRKGKAISPYWVAVAVDEAAAMLKISDGAALQEGVDELCKRWGIPPGAAVIRQFDPTTQQQE